jgi:hypothetical protein
LYLFVNFPFSFFSLGNPKSALETLTAGVYLHLPDPVRDLDFQVASLENGVDFKVVDLEVHNPKITLSDDVTSWADGKLLDEDC